MGVLGHYTGCFTHMDEDGQIFRSETHLLDALPVYARRYLLPKRESLMHRPSVRGAQRQHWWGLSERRSSWALGSGPRIVSKYFGGPGGFSTDIDGVFIVVQGFAWFPKWEGSSGEDGDLVVFPRRQLLCAYAALMNSQRFGRILELFSPHVAGGQFDLSPRYVDAIPMPDLGTLASDERAGRLITRLAELGSEPRLSDADWRVATDRITSELYGGDFFDQV